MQQGDDILPGGGRKELYDWLASRRRENGLVPGEPAAGDGGVSVRMLASALVAALVVFAVKTCVAVGPLVRRVALVRAAKP